MTEFVSEGKTVAEAVDKALGESGLRRDQVEVQILQEASSGFMGFGAKPARVRISEKIWAPEGQKPSEAKSPAAPAHKTPAKQAGRPAPRKSPPSGRSPEPAKRPDAPPTPTIPAGSKTSLIADQVEEACAAAAETVKKTLELMQFTPTSLKSSWDMEQERIKVEVETPDSERLIGKEGRTLEALQFLTTLVVSRRFKVPIAVWIDTQGYWDRREKAILSQAQKGVEEVKITGKPFRMAPMDPAMRRLVHRNLAGNPSVQTISEGQGTWRKVVLKPRK